MQMLFVRTSAIPIGDKPAADGLRGVNGPHVVAGGDACAEEAMATLLLTASLVYKLSNEPLSREYLMKIEDNDWE